jgi:CO/xanthine dehydrogenase Mo-binding subunit
MRLVTGDTDRVHAGGGSASARSMRLGFWVTAKAADEIVQKGRKIAGAMMEVAEADIEFARQRFLVRALTAPSVCSKPRRQRPETVCRRICAGR